MNATPNEVPDEADRLFADYHAAIGAAGRERQIDRAEAQAAHDDAVEEAGIILLTVFHDIDTEHDARVQAARDAYITAINSLTDLGD